MIRTPRNPAQAAALASLLAFPVAIVVGQVLRTEGPEAQALAVVQLILVPGVLLLGLGSGITALLLMRRHGRKGVLGRAITGITLNAVIVFLLLSGVVFGWRHAQERAARRQSEQRLDANLNRMDDLARRAANGQDVAAERVEAIGGFAEGMEQLAQHEQGGKRAFSLYAAAFSRGVQSRVQALLAAGQRFQQAGGYSPGGLSEPRDIDRRLEALDAIAKVNDDLDQFMQGAAAGLQAEMTKAQASPEELRKGLQALVGNLNLDLNAQIREDERKLAAHGRRLLTLLKLQWGNWKHDPGNDAAVFTDPAAQADYNQIIQELAVVAQHQVGVQKTLQDRAPNRVKR